MSDRLGVLDPHWEAYEVTADATHRFLWMWHGFNIRVIGVPKDEAQAMGYDWSWCYPRDPELVVESLRWWIPEMHDEPPGWHKRPTSLVRRAPERFRDPQYNRPRCEHGCYVDEGCRTIGCPGIR
jgi:hypothetical protein